jgi:long-chain acyl-CoA synthetase
MSLTPHSALRCETTVSSGIHAVAAHRPGKQAIQVGERSLTYGELAERMRRVTGGALAELERTQGVRAMIFAGNCLEYPEVVCGLADAGMIVSTANPRLTSAELERIAADCEPELLFVHPALEPVSSAAFLPTVKRVVVLGPDYEAWLRAQNEAAPVSTLRETDPFALVYTSGTTGQPKGVLLSHRSRVLSFFGMAMEFGCFGPEDRHLAVAPMAHGAGFVFSLAPLFFGGFVEVHEKFDPEQVLHRLGAGAHTGTFMVPTHYRTLFGLDDAVLNRYRNTTPLLRSIISNASALPYDLKEKIVAYWGEGLLHETYGSTEGGFVTNLRPEDQLRKPGSVGRPFTCTSIRLLDGEGQAVPRGEVGELYSRSASLFNGYFDRLKETEDCIRDGFVSVGDLARQDEEGNYYIVDRKSDMVISGGINIYPREIEDVLLTHPSVKEAAIVGVPDERWGESLRAFVVLQPGASLDLEGLEVHCRKTLAGFKVPRSVRFIDALPRNTGGKVMKKDLKNGD